MLLSSPSFSDNSWKYYSHINKVISHFTTNSFTFQGRIFHNLFINNLVRDIPQLLFSLHVWHNFLSTIFIHISLNVPNDENIFVFSTFMPLWVINLHAQFTMTYHSDREREKIILKCRSTWPDDDDDEASDSNKLNNISHII
jgi:hypothetical protein